MIRLILGLVAGVFSGGLVVGIVETIGHKVFPPPPGLDPTNPESVRTFMDQIPLGAKIGVFVAWGIGVLVGGSVAAFIARRGPMPAWLIGAILFGMAAWSMLMIPHPPWMWGAAVVMTSLGAYAAGRIGGRQTANIAPQSPP